MQATNASGVAVSSYAAGSGSRKATSDAAAAGGGGGGAVVVELPLHLTEKILCSISPLASARHATVCKSWAATVSARLARPVPHLFLCTPPDIKSATRGLVVSVPLDGAPPTPIPSRVRSSETNGLRCIGAAPSGRVAFAAGWWSPDVVLVNPVTGAVQRVDVGVPCLDPRHSRVMAAGAGDDSFFAVEGYKLTLWQRRQGAGEKDEEAASWWRSVVNATLNPTNNIVSAVNCNGCYYLLHEDGSLSKVDATSPPPLCIEKFPVAETLPYQFGSGRLVECDGEVLFVRQLLAYKEEVTIESCTSLTVAGFEVHRLEVTEQRWSKVEELGADRALFVSPGSSFAVRASEVEGCRGNCIYFAGESQYYSSPACREDGETSWGMYSMEERRVLFEHVVVTEPGKGAEVLWFLPRVSLGRLCKSLVRAGALRAPRV
ncbi:hypothetical protein EJB05_46474, partial [Eragrostis curvula]